MSKKMNKKLNTLNGPTEERLRILHVEINEDLFNNAMNKAQVDDSGKKRNKKIKIKEVIEWGLRMVVGVNHKR